MNLSRYGREHYDIKLVTDPQVSAMEASFDDGMSWVAGDALTGEDAGWFRWLVSGPSAEPESPVDAVVLSVGKHTPIGRATDNPEVIVRELPAISVV